MLDENALQESINRRLSGLCADAQRRARIRSRVRQPSRAGSRRLSPVLICLLTAALVTASVALAEHWNLFHLFGREEQRYAHVAEEAALTSAAPVTMEQAPLDSVVAQIDSAYYDGLTLHLAFSVAQGARYEAYTPSAEELAGMSELSALPVAIQHAQAPGADILLAYNQALQSATPFGYRAYTVYAGDHTTTDDGIDLPPSGGSVSYTEAGVYCEMREFASPLPDALDGRDVLHLRIQLYQSVQTVYFDGQTCYTATQRSEAGTLTASVPLSSEAPMAMAGTAQVGDILCTAEARGIPHGRGDHAPLRRAAGDAAFPPGRTVGFGQPAGNHRPGRAGADIPAAGPLPLRRADGGHLHPAGRGRASGNPDPVRFLPPGGRSRTRSGRIAHHSAVPRPLAPDKTKRVVAMDARRRAMPRKRS